MRRTLITVAALLALACAAPAAAQTAKTNRPPTAPTTGSQPGQISPAAMEPRIQSQVYIGEPAPVFELDGTQGRPVNLAHLKGYWLLLVFEDRRTDLTGMKEIEPDLRKLGVKPYGICADKVHVLVSHVQKEKLPVVLMSDFTGEISQLYGLYDTRMRQIRPGFVLIDRQGVVHMALLGQRLPYDEMLALVKSSVITPP
jgi:peroxiredoxin